MGMTAWAPERRRSASKVVLIAAIALIGFAVLGWFITAPQVEQFLLAILVALVIVLVFQLLVVVTGRGQSLEAPLAEEPPWTPPAGPSEPWQPAAPPPAEAITLKCSNCSTVFDVQDTGARPLVHTCPGCGLKGELTEEDLGPAPAARGVAPEEVAVAEAPAAQPPAPAAPMLTLKCGNCATVFDVQDTGARPLRHHCPGCGLEGELTEEDLGPPPAPVEPAWGGVRSPPAVEAPAPVVAAPYAPAAPVAPPVPPRPGPRTLRLRCKSCRTVFPVTDTGERPLYHACPGCKATGVLR